MSPTSTRLTNTSFRLPFAVIGALACLALIQPAAADLNGHISGTELFDTQSPTIRPIIAIDMPGITQCVGAACLTFGPTACGNIKAQANFDLDTDFLIYVEIGFGGPGAYGGYSDRCN